MGLSGGKANTVPESKNYNYLHIWQGQNVSSICGENEDSCNQSATIQNLWVAARFNPYFCLFSIYNAQTMIFVLQPAQ